MGNSTDIARIFDIGGAALQAQSFRARVIAENMSNADTTATVAGKDPYRRRIVTFRDEIDRANGISKVRVDSVRNDNSPFRQKFDPSHPAADAKGYVLLPNVNPIIESMDFRQVNRSMDANINMIEMTKAVLLRIIDTMRS